MPVISSIETSRVGLASPKQAAAPLATRARRLAETTPEPTAATGSLAAAMAPAAPSQAHAPLPETLRGLMREHAITYLARSPPALSSSTATVTGSATATSPTSPQAATPPAATRSKLLARAFELPVSYFAEYRLAELRRQLDERGGRVRNRLPHLPDDQPPPAAARLLTAAPASAPAAAACPLGTWWRSSAPVDSRAGDAEELLELAHGVLAGAVELDEVRLLRRG